MVLGKTILLPFPLQIIYFKILLSVYKALNSLGLKYMFDLLLLFEPS